MNKIILATFEVGQIYKSPKLKGQIVVEDIILTKEKMKEWGVNDFGIFINTEEYGLIFEPENCIDDLKLKKC